MLHLDPKSDPARVEYYEGLCRKTAARIERFVEPEYDDLVQVLRIKCWLALESFDPAKARQPIHGYVFSCVRNQVKDLLKKKKRNEVYIEDAAGAPDGAHDNGSGANLRRDRFHDHYWRVEESEIFRDVLGETPLIPPTLTERQRWVVTCMYLEYGQAEIAEVLGITRREVAKAVRAIKVKMSTLSPSYVAEDEGPIG